MQCPFYGKKSPVADILVATLKKAIPESATVVHIQLGTELGTVSKCIGCEAKTSEKELLTLPDYILSSLQTTRHLSYLSFTIGHFVGGVLVENFSIYF